MFGNIYGLDLGTYEIKVFDKKQDKICRERDVIAIKNKKNITIFQKMVIPVYPKSAEAPNRPASCNCEDTIFTSAITRG